MDWSDNVIILSKIAYGESSFILTVMSENHGRWAGFVKCGFKKRQSKISRTLLECGDIAQCHWRSRIAENLGDMTIEPKMHPFVLARSDKAKLLAIKAVCDICFSLCPERQAIKGVYEQLEKFLINLGDPLWLLNYVVFEVDLLRHIGYGLDLSKCAVTGTSDDLIYVSPKTGHAVSRQVGEPYKDKILPLPRFLLDYKRCCDTSWQDVFDGLKLSEYFLRKVFNGYSKIVPSSRAMLLQALAKDCKNVDKLILSLDA